METQTLLKILALHIYYPGPIKKYYTIKLFQNYILDFTSKLLFVKS